MENLEKKLFYLQNDLLTCLKRVIDLENDIRDIKIINQNKIRNFNKKFK